MLDLLNYFIAWAAYLLAALGIFGIFWRLTSRYLLKELAYILRALLAAVLFTPWYVSPEVDILAPAFMISLLDAITIEAQASIRAMVPVVLAMISGLLLVLMGLIASKVFRRSS